MGIFLDGYNVFRKDRIKRGCVVMVDVRSNFLVILYIDLNLS